jgi:hypothetical protein
MLGTEHWNERFVKQTVCRYARFLIERGTVNGVNQNP